MNYIVWQKEFSVGYETIDNQHKKIIELINDLFNSSVLKIDTISSERIISELTEYIEHHFAEEEMLFEQYNYKEALEHIKEHNMFTSTVSELFEKYHKDSKELAIHVTRFLQKWLIEHILETDMRYKGAFGNKK